MGLHEDALYFGPVEGERKIILNRDLWEFSKLDVDISPGAIIL